MEETLQPRCVARGEGVLQTRKPVVRDGGKGLGAGVHALSDVTQLHSRLIAELYIGDIASLECALGDTSFAPGYFLHEGPVSPTWGHFMEDLPLLKALAIAVSLAFSMPAVAQSTKGDSSAQSGGSANQSASSGGSSGQSASTGQTTSLNQDSARSDDQDWGWIGLLGLLGLAGLKRRRDHDRHLDSTTTRTTAR